MNPIERFENHLIENGIAPKTIESYVGDVRGFCSFLSGMGVSDPTDLKRFYMVSYKNHLAEQNYAIATINKKINSLQAYNLFLVEQGMEKEMAVTLRKDRIKVAAGSEGEVEVFSEQEVNKLLILVQDRSKISLRNHLIVWLLLYTDIHMCVDLFWMLQNNYTANSCLMFEGIYMTKVGYKPYFIFLEKMTMKHSLFIGNKNRMDGKTYLKRLFTDDS